MTEYQIFSDQGQYPKCNTCMACFPNTDKVKEHYRGSWHLHNSKRRSKGLPPLKHNEFKLLMLNSSRNSQPPRRNESAPPNTKRRQNQTIKKPGRLHVKPGDLESSHRDTNNVNCSSSCNVVLSEGVITETMAATISTCGNGAQSDTIEIYGDDNSDADDADDGGGDGEDEDDGSGEWGDIDEDGEFIDGEDGESLGAPNRFWAPGSGSDAAAAPVEQMQAYEAAKAKSRPTVSLFDDTELDSTADCLRYMSNKFGFFVPDAEYLVDVDGLLVYLAEKVRLGGYCLYCQKRFMPGRPCQSHMLSKSHCKLRYEEGIDLDEYVDFYDFSAQTDGDVDHLKEETEDDVELVAAETASGELILPNGRVVGHRSLRRHYKRQQGLRSQQHR